MYANKLASIIRYLVYLLALTPLIITPWTIFPFIFGRGLIVQFLIETIFILWLILVFYDHPIRSRVPPGGTTSNGVDKQYRPQKNTLFILLGAYVAISFISSLLGVDFNRSFWSIEERFTGWFYLAHALVFFIVVSSILKTKREWLNYFRFNVFVALAMFGIAALSLFGVKFWGVDLGTRISGTLGNTIFLAAYFILNLIFALYLFCGAHGKKNKAAWLALALIIFYGIILTQSRGAFLGVAAGAGAALLYCVIFNKQKKVRAFILLLAVAAVLLVGAIFIFKNSGFVRDNEILNRIASISISTGTARTRLLSWQIALSAIKERPFLGWGAEGFYAAFNKYYNPELLRYSYYETWSDKPHNAFLEVGVSSGIIGMAAYLAIFGYAGYLIFKKRKDNIFSLSQAAVLIGGLVAYFVQNLFAFDTSVSLLLFFVLLNFINMPERPAEEIAAPLRPSDDGLRRGEVKIKKTAFIPFAAILAAAAILNFSPFAANIKFYNVFFVEDVAKKIDILSYQEAEKYPNPYKEEWRNDLGKSVLVSFRAGKEDMYTKEEAIFALSEVLKNAQEHENNAYYHLLSGGLFAELGKIDARYFDSANKELDRAFVLSPERQHIYFALARYYVLKGDENSMMDTYKKAIALEPKAGISYWEAARQLYVVDPNNVLVQEWLIKAGELFYTPEGKNEFLFFFQKTFKYFFENKNYVILERLYGRMEDMEPGEAKWHAQRATTLYLLKNYDEAIAEINAAIALDESYREEGEKFIKMIKAGK